MPHQSVADAARPGEQAAAPQPAPAAVTRAAALSAMRQTTRDKPRCKDAWAPNSLPRPRRAHAVAPQLVHTRRRAHPNRAVAPGSSRLAIAAHFQSVNIAGASDGLRRHPMAPKCRELAPKCRELAPECCELAPKCRELAPECCELASSCHATASPPPELAFKAHEMGSAPHLSQQKAPSVGMRLLRREALRGGHSLGACFLSRA